MRRILITGMSGTGKSAIGDELIRLGYHTIDLDTPTWSHWVSADPLDPLTPSQAKDWVWQEDRVRELLRTSDPNRLFITGCAQNMNKLFEFVDLIVLLSAPLETIMDRLEARTGLTYGHTAEEREKVTALVATIEPRLRQVAHLEIDTRTPISETVRQLLARVHAYSCKGSGDEDGGTINST